MLLNLDTWFRIYVQRKEQVNEPYAVAAAVGV
jgi:hypothetical protein